MFAKLFILSKLLQGVSAEWHTYVRLCIYIYIYAALHIYTLSSEFNPVVWGRNRSYYAQSQNLLSKILLSTFITSVLLALRTGQWLKSERSDDYMDSFPICIAVSSHTKSCKNF